MKTNISLRSIAALLLIAVPSMSIVSCTDDEDLASFEAPEPMVTVPAEEWDMLGPTEFEKVGPDASTASQIAKINEKYDFNMRNVSCSTNGRRKVAGILALEALGSEIANTALKQVKEYGKNYAKQKLTGFANKLLGIKETQDSTLIKLNMINSQLGEINTKLNEMTEMLKNIDDKADNTYDAQLFNAYDTYKNRRENLAKNNEKWISKIAYAMEKDSVEAEKLILDYLSMWANSQVNGNNAFVESYCYAKAMCECKIQISAGGSMGTYMNLCTLYDKIAYDSFPWENLAYESREQFRALQAIQTLQGLELGYMYSCAMSQVNNADKQYYEGQVVEFQNAIENVAKFFEANKIVYHKTKAICQIKGSHFEMDLKDGIKRHPALIWKDGKPCSMKDTEIPFLYGERSSSMSDQELKDAKSHCLTQADADRMKTYFDNFLGKASCPKDWFSLAGIDMSSYDRFSQIILSETTTICFPYSVSFAAGYRDGKPASWYGSFDGYDLHVDFNNLLSLMNTDGMTSGKFESDCPIIAKMSEVSDKKNEYKWNYYSWDVKIPAWHSLKINREKLTFDGKLLTLTLNRLK